MLFRLMPPDLKNPAPRGGFATFADMRTYAWLNLVWSVFILTAPIVAEDFPHWLLPTLASYVVFLWLYFRLFFRDEYESPVRYALAIAALGFAVIPFNPGAQGYLIYACAFFAFAATLRDALRLMVGMLALFALEWWLLEFPWKYSLSALVVGPVVGSMNLLYKRNQQRNAELKLSHEEVRRLAALAERERIGRDLHDLLGHTLSLITLKSELANKLFDRDVVAAKREMADVERVARDALAQVRRAVTGIRAAGFAAELASGKLLLESNGVHLRYELADVALSAEIETALAMTVREAITNVQRHARASSANVMLGVEKNDIVLRIEDDGRGDAIVPGNGLTGMRERLHAIGAELRVESQRGKGTTLTVKVPAPRTEVERAPAAPLAVESR